MNARATVRRAIDRAPSILLKYGHYIYPYCDGVPAFLVGIRIALETNGNPRAVSSIGEVGLLQLSKTTRKKYGVSIEQAKNPAINLKIGLHLWNTWWSRVNDNYYFGQVEGAMWLTTAVGPGATRAILKTWAPDRWNPDEQIWEHVNDSRGFINLRNFFGTQSSELVRFRVEKALYAADATRKGISSVYASLLFIAGGLIK